MDSKELSQLLFSSSNFLSSSFERSFTFQASVEFAKVNVSVPVSLGAIYIVLCFIGNRIMYNVKPFDLRVPLAIWNAILCTFSFIGMCRTVGVLSFFLHFSLILLNRVL